jgi:outer membrane protein
MQKLGGVLVGIFLLMVLGCQAEAPKFGVVDLFKVVNSSKVGQKAKADFEAFLKSKQTELAAKEEAVKKLEKSVKEPGSKVKPEEFQKAAGEYQREAMTAEALVKKKDQELKTGLFQQVKKIIESIGQEEKYLMIFTAENIPFYQKAVDVTEKVAQKLDESAGGGAGVSSPAAPPATKTEQPATKTEPPATKTEPPATK